MALTPAPTPPTTADPTDFDDRADAFVFWQAETFVPELDDLAEGLDATAAEVAIDRALATNAAAQAALRADDAADRVNEAVVARDLAQGYATSALNAPGTSATSSTSRSLTTGSKAFTLNQTGKLFSVGQTVVVTRTSDPTKRMVGPITSFAADVLTMDVQLLSSTGGPYTDWTVALSAPALNGLATQAEAEAGVANDKDMSPLRVAQAIQALGKPYTVIGSITPANGDTSAAFTSIPTAYEDLLIEVEDVVVAGNLAFILSFGDSTPTYSTGATVSPAAVAGSAGGAILIPAAKRDYGCALASLVAGGAGSSPSTVSSTTHYAVAWHVAGGVRALRLTLSSGGAFSGAGTLRLLGR